MFRLLLRILQEAEGVEETLQPHPGWNIQERQFISLRKHCYCLLKLGLAKKTRYFRTMLLSPQVRTSQEN